MPSSHHLAGRLFSFFRSRSRVVSFLFLVAKTLPSSFHISLRPELYSNRWLYVCCAKRTAEKRRQKSSFLKIGSSNAIAHFIVITSRSLCFCIRRKLPCNGRKWFSLSLTSCTQQTCFPFRRSFPFDMREAKGGIDGEKSHHEPPHTSALLQRWLIGWCELITNPSFCHISCGFLNFFSYTLKAISIDLVECVENVSTEVWRRRSLCWWYQHCCWYFLYVLFHFVARESCIIFYNIAKLKKRHTEEQNSSFAQGGLRVVRIRQNAEVCLKFKGSFRWCAHTSADVCLNFLVAEFEWKKAPTTTPNSHSLWVLLSFIFLQILFFGFTIRHTIWFARAKEHKWSLKWWRWQGDAKPH